MRRRPITWFSARAQNLTAGVASNTITIELEDAFGNPVDASGALPVTLNTTSAKGSFSPPSPLTIPAGADTANFQYTDTAAGTPTITASAGGFAPITQVETVSPAAASQLVFTTGPQTLTAGVASGTITAAMEDAFGNPVNASGAVAVNLSTTSAKGTFSPASPLAIPAGAGAVSFQYKDTAAGTPAITAAAAGLASATQQETVNPAAAGQLVFTTTPQTLTAGVASGTMTVALEDTFGNTVTATHAALSVGLSTTSAKGTFTPASPLTIPAGASTASFRYTDSVAATPTITATISGVGSATQQETVSPAATSQVVFTTSPQNLTAGAASGTMTIALEDAFGNPVNATSAVTVNLSTTSANGAFAPQSPLTIPAGVATVSFLYTDSAAGTPTITAAVSGVGSATQKETVNPAAASQLTFATLPQTLTAGVISGTITVALEDAFGNPVTSTAR